MGIELAKLVVSLRADVGKLRKDLDKSQGLIKSSGKKSASVFKSVLGATLVTQGITRGLSAVTGLMRESIELAKIQGRAETKLAATLKATGHAAGFTADQLKGYASNLQKVTTFGDEQILESMSLMVTFNKITGDTFKRATEAAIDLSATGFGDLRGTTIQLSKALQDPVKGMNAMAKSGVSFDEATQNQIKTLVEQNKVLEAQALILEAVEGQVKGVAKALANTDVGRIKRMNNAWGDVKEELGKGLLDALFNMRMGVVEFFNEFSNGKSILVETAELIAQIGRETRLLLSGQTGKSLGASFLATNAMLAQNMTGIDVAEKLGFGPTGLLIQDAVGSVRERNQVKNAKRSAAPTATTSPAGVASFEGAAAKGGMQSGLFGISELSRSLQQNVLEDSQTKMVGLLEKSNEIQKQQLDVLKDQPTSGEAVPARLAPG